MGRRGQALRNGPGITSRSSRNQDQTKLWQGLLTLPLGRPKVSNPKPGGRPTVQQTAGSGDPPNRQLEIRKLFPARSLIRAPTRHFLIPIVWFIFARVLPQADKKGRGIAVDGHPAGTPGATGVERLSPRENGQRLSGGE